VYASEYGLAWIGARVVYDLRCEACDHLLRLPTPFYDHSSAGFLLSKVTYDAQQISATASEAITVSIRNTLTIIFMLGYLLWINWHLTLIAFAAFPAVAYALRRIRKRMKKVSGMVQDRTGSLTHALEEAIGAHRVVKIFGGEAYRRACATQRTAAARDGEAVQLPRSMRRSTDHRVDRGPLILSALKQTTSTCRPVTSSRTSSRCHLLTQLKRSPT
jgi:subfamily B ATP-binding cassette protein MsbA